MNRRDVDTVAEQAQLDLVYALGILRRLVFAPDLDGFTSARTEAREFLAARDERIRARRAARPPCDECGDPSDFTIGGMHGCYSCANNAGDGS